MFYRRLAMFSGQVRKIFTLLTLLVLGLGTPALGRWAYAQPPGQQPSSQSPPGQENPNQQPAPPEAGGPGNDVGTYAIPKKKEDPPPPPPVKPTKVEGDRKSTRLNSSHT